MGIIDLDSPTLDRPISAPENAYVTPSDIGQKPNQESPSVGSIFGAAFRSDNIVASAAASGAFSIPQGVDESLNTWEEIKGGPYEQHWNKFVDVHNRPHFEMVKQDIDRENQDRKIIDEAPWYLKVPATLAANITDPTILIPGGAYYKGAKGGFSVAKSALSVGASFGAATTLQEGGLLATQQTRTPTEAAVDIGASTFLGGLLGAGGAALLTRAEWKSAVKNIERDLESGVSEMAASPGSLGAAAATGPGNEARSVAGMAGAGLAAGTQKLNPGLRLIHSDNPTTRETALNLFEMTQYLRGNNDGLATPIAVETLRKEWNAGLMTAAQDSKDFYNAYWKAGGTVKRDEFNQMVGKAMRRGDQDPVPEVAKAAQSWRKNVFDPLKDAAIEAKLLPKDVSQETAASYFSRLWNRHRLIGEEPQFKQVVTDWVMQNAPRWQRDFDAETEAQLLKLKGKQGEDAARSARDYATERRIEREARFGDDDAIRGSSRNVADEVFNTLTGKTESTTRPEFITIGSRGPLKERTFNIPDELVERWLESDVDIVGRRYQRIMSADVELAKKFGSPDMKEQIQAIRDKYAEMRNGVTDEKQLTKLGKQETDDAGDIEGVRDLLRGTYAHSAWEKDFGKIIRVANSFQYILKMGQVVLASLQDVVRIPMTQGLKPFMEAGFSGLANLSAFKMSVNEAKAAGNIAERVLAHRMATLAEINDYYTSRGPVEKMLENMTNAASAWNGIRLWTDSTKMIAAVAIQNNILRNAERGTLASAKGKKYLNFLGIDESMAGRIADQFKRFGSVDGTVRIAGTEQWTDEVARTAYRAALNKDMDSTIVTKSVADIPLFGNTPLGRLIFQFNTFNLASHGRILLRGLQEDKTRFIGSLAAMTSLGMLQAYLYALSSNTVHKLPSFSDNPGWWIAEGLDRSGVLAVPFVLANNMEKLTGFNPIKTPIKAKDQGSTESQKNQVRGLGSVFGPTAGTVEDAAKTINIPKKLIQGEEVGQAQKNSAERLIPFNSYIGVRQMLKYLVNPPTN